MRRDRWPILATICLLILLPVSWFAPILRAGVLPIFGLSEISILSGLMELFGTDILLAALVTLFAIIAPMGKLIAVLLVQLSVASARILPVVNLLGRLAMADIFLIALYIVVVKGAGLARIETAWGLYLFTACVLGSLAIGHLTARAASRISDVQ